MKERIRSFILEGGDFEETALALYRWQRANNIEYDRFCGEVSVRRWMDIPAVPSTLFRDLTFTSFPLADATTVFRTSGTTAGMRGAVHLLDTDIYTLSARSHVERCLGPLPSTGISLVPTGSESSLGHMCSSFVQGMPNYFSETEGVHTAEAWAALVQASAHGDALFIPGTAFALADLMDCEHPPVSMPPGSIVMVTGGFKGRRRSVPPAILYETLARRLPGAQVVGEYGMSELASQLWAVPAGAPFVPPPWMRVLAVDPWTGAVATRGLLRFYDLANHQTVLAVETQDVGVVLADGSVRLEGRLEGAVPRGCSLSVEEANA
jgi:acyl-CoA synthetase (AMP-forming)/AMP-acid ligase II